MKKNDWTTNPIRSPADTVKLDIDVSEAVELWLAEDRAFHEGSGATTKYVPRVLARNLGAPVARRPFKLKGHYCVKWDGTARLTSPERLENGVIVFSATWSW